MTCSLYVHIPFCEKKCFYCSFVVSVGQRQRVDRYLQSLFGEARSYEGLSVSSVYIGGGTPTFLNDEQLEKLFTFLRKKFNLDGCLECTVEANPEGLRFSTVKRLKDLGINRISLGVQSLNDRHLKYLGRIHDRRKALDAYEAIRKGGISNINLDMMFGFPGQSLSELRRDAEAVCELGSEHLSLYALTVEPNSRFHVNREKLVDEEIQAEQYRTVCDILEKNHYGQYEVSNFSRPGMEARHNVHYWEGGDYVGLGLGAHSHLNGRRFWNVTKLTEYIRRIEREESVIQGAEDLNVEQRFWEAVLLGLRMTKGVNIMQKEKYYGHVLSGEKESLIDDFVKQGWLKRQGELIKVSSQGRMLLDEISARLI